MDESFIPQKVKAEFWTAQRLNNSEVNPQKYGLGWRVHQLDLGDGANKVIAIHHGGVSAGAQSFLLVLPQYQLSIAVNANIRTKEFWDFGKVSHVLAKEFVKRVETLSTPL